MCPLGVLLKAFTPTYALHRFFLKLSQHYYKKISNFMAEKGIIPLRRNGHGLSPVPSRPLFIIDRFAIPDKPGEHKKAVVRFIGLPNCTKKMHIYVKSALKRYISCLGYPLLSASFYKNLPH